VVVSADEENEDVAVSVSECDSKAVSIDVVVDWAVDVSSSPADDSDQLALELSSADVSISASVEEAPVL
jgi:hypothetical protein